MGINIYKKSQLTEKQLAVLESEMRRHRKSTLVAYILWILCAPMGVHQFYLGNTKRGYWYLGLWIPIAIYDFAILFPSGYSFASSDSTQNLSTIGIILLLLVGVLALILVGFLLYDLFTIPRQIREANEKEEDKIIQEITSIS